MPEMPNPRHDEGDVVLVADGDGFVVLDGAAGLDDGGDARFGGGFGAVGEGEEGVAGESGTLGRVARLLDGESDGLDAVHLACADALEGAVFGDDDGVGLDVLDDAPREEEFGEFGGRGWAVPSDGQVGVGEGAVVARRDEHAADDGLEQEAVLGGTV